MWKMSAKTSRELGKIWKRSAKRRLEHEKIRKRKAKIKLGTRTHSKEHIDPLCCKNGGKKQAGNMKTRF